MSGLLVVLSIVLAVVPMVGLLLLVWWLDRYDREPLWLFALTFLWGAIGGVVIALIGNGLLDLTLTPVAMALDAAAQSGSMLQSIVGPTVVAPLVEEPAKAAILIPVIASRSFDDITDGFVYGAAAGLGFGMTENALYFLNAVNNPEAWFDTVAVRTAFSAVMHGACTAMVGAGLGWGRFRRWWGGLFGGGLGLLLAMGVHAWWNGLLSFGAVLPDGEWLASLAIFSLPGIIGAVFLAFQATLLAQSWRIRRELIAESEQGHVPRPHAGIVASWWRRQGYDWLPAGVDHRRYIRALTTLALRRHQARLPGGRRDAFYADDVERLRRHVAVMLKHADYDGE
ncbi:MAG: PrsW family intramembrane metalloprotease [Myxococcota bacterium]